jgi:soluble lytic murein transglycosylase-like protein
LFMRRITRKLTRSPATRAFIAGAAILAGTIVGKAHAEGMTKSPTASDELAMVIPRVATDAETALPQPLPPSEVARLRRIFALQRAGNIAAATRETAGVDTSNPVEVAMLGHVLADRHLGRYTKPSADELRAWLDRWSDLSDAPAIHGLLRTRAPRGAELPPAPAVVTAFATDEPVRPAPVPEESESAGDKLDRNSGIDRTIWDAARGRRGAAAVERELSDLPRLSTAYRSQLRGEAARILFTLNRDNDALAVGARGVSVCAGRDHCEEASLSGYVAGLAAWRMDRPDQARDLFEAAWHAELTTSALRAASAWWAARANLRLHDHAAYATWINRAAQERTTFYGMMARRTLGRSNGMPPNASTRELLSEADIEAVAAQPAGMRAFALLQLGEDGRAEAELRQLWPQAQNSPPLGRAMMLVAARAGLTDLAARLADLVQTEDGRPRENTRFPLPRLRPAGGFKVDPALIYGIARTESNFNPDDVSPAGARGIMQIMPETASFITGGRLADSLRDSAYNLDLGQRYVLYLARPEVADGDLIRVIGSYNAGPGNLQKWTAGIRDKGDPLLFMEAIPVDETRAYIPRVLTYTWIYAARMHIAAPSLDELAAGLWPRYHGADSPQEPPARLH